MISRRILAALALLCCFIVPAHAQKTKTQLDAEVNANWPDNATGGITPALLRSTVIDTISSYVDWLSCTGSGGLVYWNAGSPTCLAAGANGQVLGLAAGLPAWISLSANLAAGTGITLSGSTNVTVSLTNQISAGSVGSSTQIPVINYNAQGQITGVSTAAPSPVYTAVTGVPANSILGNNTGSTANALTLNGAQVGSLLCTPVRHSFASGSGATFTTDTCNGVTATWLEVDLQGGGGGGGGSGSGSPPAGGGGSPSSFGALTANGGSAGTSATGGAGGACSGSLGTQQNFPGSSGFGTSSLTASSVTGGSGAASFYGGYGAPGTTGAAGGTAPVNSGGGGAGGSSNATTGVGAGGGAGAGCHIKTIILSPAATYTYTVGALANGASAGTSGAAGGNGAAGLLDIIAHWQ